MTTAKNGDTVQVEYVGKLADGSVFDSSEGGDPIEFTLGEGRVIPGFEHAVLGMEEGEQRTVNVEAAEAYGDRNAELLIPVPKEHIPEDIRPEVGQRLQVTQQDGSSAVVTVVAVGDDSVTLDANHPLAGEKLTFEITLVKVA